MARHTLSAGRTVLYGLTVLGRAIGYDVEAERKIGDGEAAVDLAWYAAGDSDIPLMVFEVESQASASMANNAMKVLAKDVDDFVKPLFFFHVLLAGGSDNERIANLRRQWGSHNYRVYRFNESGERGRLVNDVLAQHRRVSNQVVASRLFAALGHEAWTGIDRLQIMTDVERRGFISNYVREYALCAIDDDVGWSLFVRRLGQHLKDPEPEVPTFGGTFADYAIPGLLEWSLLICGGEVSDDDGPAVLEAWQTSGPPGFRQIGPHVGLSQDHDEYVLGVAPFFYAAAGLLLRRCPSSFAWLVADLTTLVQQEREKGLKPEYLLPSAIWLAHLAASSEPRSFSERAYETAARVVADVGGAPQALVDSPPPILGLEDFDEWFDTWWSDPRNAWPDAEALAGAFADLPCGLWAYPSKTVMRIIVANDWYEWADWPTRDLAAALYQPPG